MYLTNKSRWRRSEIRRNRPDTPRLHWQHLRSEGIVTSLGIAAVFCISTIVILMLKQEVVPYRPDQWIPHDIVSRVGFPFSDQELLAQKRREAREIEPRVYRSSGDVWANLSRELLALPDRVADNTVEQLPADLKDIFDPGAVTALRQFISGKGREDYSRHVEAFIDALRNHRISGPQQNWPIVILPQEQRQEDLKADRNVIVAGAGTLPTRVTFALKDERLRGTVNTFAQRIFMFTLQPKIAEFTLATLQPTHELDPMATAEAQNQAARDIAASAGNIWYPPNSILVPKANRVFTQRDWQLLREENRHYLNSIKGWAIKTRAGLAGIVLLMTVVLCGYVARYQPRVVTNHARAAAIVALLVSMLLLAQIAGIGSGPLYLFGLAPTLLVAMILTIAYDQRFAIGVASMHGILVTLALGQGMPFFVILWVGVLSACFLLDDIRTRSKLIEVGGAASLAMIAATISASVLTLDPVMFVVKNCLYAGAAGLAVGFVVLGILPFVEKAFRITTSMTLLELADASQPLLRRLGMEAPGTYNHSLQVATLAESAAESVGANSLLCRVGSYYHDVGKINKADYFIENQSGGENRHLNLSPSVSLLIIIGHVKDGVELAREYNLPTNLVTFIQQHHGTTLVEYFYHQACTQKDQRQPDEPAISETQYRYPGPKPRTREVAIVMLADAVESACRAMSEPTASRVEALVHDLSMKRLMDGQFDECDLTMRELENIERSMMKTLLGIYHGRIAYPSSAAANAAPAMPPIAAVKSA